MLHAYCVRRAGEPPPCGELRGVGGAAVELLEAEGLGLWVSPGVPGEATLERLREHDAVVRAALRSATPLPMRYGVRFADEARAGEALRGRQEEFLAVLERVEGRIEMGIRICWTPPAPEEVPLPSGAGSGRAYLEARRRGWEERERIRGLAGQIVGRVERFFAEPALPTARILLPEPGVAGTLAHLVHRGGVRWYQERVDEARRELPLLELIRTGPWAPYSFV